MPSRVLCSGRVTLPRSFYCYSQLLLFTGLSAAFPRPSRLNCFASARTCGIPSSRTCSKLITCRLPGVCESNCISCLKMSKNDCLPYLKADGHARASILLTDVLHQLLLGGETHVLAIHVRGEVLCLWAVVDGRSVVTSEIDENRPDLELSYLHRLLVDRVGLIAHVELRCDCCHFVFIVVACRLHRPLPYIITLSFLR